MKKIALLCIAILTLVACKQGGQSSNENTMLIVGQETDSTTYGILVSMHGDSLKMVSESGDTMWICHNCAKKFGTPEAGHRLAVLFEQGSVVNAKNIIDITLLMGRWVEPDAVDEGMVQGIELQEGGAASSINSRSDHYVSWRIYNGKLLMRNSMEGYVDNDVPEDTLIITFLSTDSLRIATSMSKRYYRRSVGDTDDNRDYSAYVSPDGSDNAFDPEGSAPEGSPTEIPENDRVF